MPDLWSVSAMTSDSPVSPERLRAAYLVARDALRAERVPAVRRTEVSIVVLT